jgi:hypothetical protein
MTQYVIPGAIKYIMVLASVAAIVAAVDIVMLVKRKGTTHLKGILPAIDSILVIAGFMAFSGSFIALIQSANKIAGSKIPMESTFSEINQKWQMTFPTAFWEFLFKVILCAFVTVLIAWLLFFFFFEVWYVIRLQHRKFMKKLSTPSIIKTSSQTLEGKNI